MRSSGHDGGRERSVDSDQEKEQKRDAGRGPGRVSVIGLGPGDRRGLSFAAREAIEEAETVIGYKIYVDQIRPLLTGKEVLSSGMTKELDRAGVALDLALAGTRVAVVSGGDPGIYAMAGVVFELARARGLALGDAPGAVAIEVFPGIPALAAAAAILGAPLSHDFACVSLSDRLTPWELIAKRLELAARADFVLVLYNPRSRGRDWQYGRALEIVGRERAGQTPVGLVGRALREGQSVTLTTLNQAPGAEVDMQTIVIIGNSRTFAYEGRMVTPRGYLDKYPKPTAS